MLILLPSSVDNHRLWIAVGYMVLEEVDVCSNARRVLRLQPEVLNMFNYGYKGESILILPASRTRNKGIEFLQVKSGETHPYLFSKSKSKT